MSDARLQVLALSRYDRLGAASRLRLLQYLPYLESSGFSVRVQPLLSDRYVSTRVLGRMDYGAVAQGYLRRFAALCSKRRLDLVWIEKEALPWVPYPLERLLLPGGVPYVVDCDDAWFYRYSMNRSALVRAALGYKLQRLMRGAAMVVAGNEFLAERARESGAARVEILPTVVDVDRYPVSARPRQGPFRIGWIGHPFNLSYVEAITAALRRACADGSMMFVVVSAGDWKAQGIPLETHQWTEATEAEQIGRFDAGIMPLDDGLWERGKCGYKLIQYMASGKAVVASPVGVNVKLVQPGVNGFLASSEDEWVDALRRLRDDPALAERMGRAGRRRVEEHYNLRLAAPRLAQLLGEAARLPYGIGARQGER